MRTVTFRELKEIQLQTLAAAPGTDVVMTAPKLINIIEMAMRCHIYEQGCRQADLDLIGMCISHISTLSPMSISPEIAMGMVAQVRAAVQLDAALAEIAELPSVRQDEAATIAQAAREKYAHLTAETKPEDTPQVLQLDDYRPHISASLVCPSCSHAWQGVYPVAARQLECPKCATMFTPPEIAAD